MPSREPIPELVRSSKTGTSSCFILREPMPAASDSYLLTTQSGERRIFGDGPPAFSVRVPDLGFWEDLARRGTYAAAVAFIRARFDIEGDFLAAIRWWQRGHAGNARRRFVKALAWLRLESWHQSAARARRNIESHYDRSNAFYQQFLDRLMVYSCAYFADPTWSLEEAQLAKLDRICSKLDLQATDRFLDVGCGWGGLVLHAAEQFGATAVGCTLSREQLAFANEQVHARKLAPRVTIEGRDYRQMTGRFDKIASVGMYEHVGRRRLRAYFETLAHLLDPDGLVLNHGIVRPQTVGDDGTTEFLRHHVFPGGELPHLSDVVLSAEQAGFEVLDVENLRPHYALTCAAWVSRLQAHRDVCLALVDETTYRTWLLYLAGSAVSFERGQTDIYQVLLARRSRRAARRLTRVG